MLTENIKIKKKHYVCKPGSYQECLLFFFMSKGPETGVKEEEKYRGIRWKEVDEALAEFHKTLDTDMDYINC